VESNGKKAEHRSDSHASHLSHVYHHLRGLTTWIRGTPRIALAGCRATLGFREGNGKKGHRSGVPATRENVKRWFSSRIHEFWSCTWHLQTINHAKSYRTPSKTLLYWQLMATYSAESCLKNYCDDVSNKVHSVTTAVVAVSTARHHFVSWKDYPVGPLRRGFEMGLHDGAH